MKCRFLALEDRRSSAGFSEDGFSLAHAFVPAYVLFFRSVYAKEHARAWQVRCGRQRTSFGKCGTEASEEGEGGEGGGTSRLQRKQAKQCRKY